MPTLIAIFIALQLLHAPNLVRTAFQGVDHNANAQVGMKATAITYTASTAPWRDKIEDKKGGCDFQLLARVTGRGPIRARINMIEQLLDESWSPRFRIDAGDTAYFKVEFLEPAGSDFGVTIEERSTQFKCRARHPGALR